MNAISAILVFVLITLLLLGAGGNSDLAPYGDPTTEYTPPEGRTK